MLLLPVPMPRVPSRRRRERRRRTFPPPGLLRPLRPLAVGAAGAGVDGDAAVGEAALPGDPGVGEGAGAPEGDRER